MEAPFNSTIDVNGYQMIIRPKTFSMALLPVVIFLCIWLSGWTAGGYTALHALFGMLGRFGKDGPIAVLPVIFLMVWLTGWFFGEAGALYVVLWVLFGREIVIKSQGNLTIKNDILGIAWTRIYNVNAITQLGRNKTNISPSEKSGKIGLTGVGSISFQYEGRVNRFALVWKKEEIDYIMMELRKYMPGRCFENE